MNKITLVLRPHDHTSFTAWYLTDFWTEYFNIAQLDESTTYDKQSTLFVIPWQELSDPRVIQLRDNGYKIVVERLWEQPEYRTDFHWIECNDWFWYNESIWWKSLGQHNRQPLPDIKKLALMPIRRPRRHRRELAQVLKDYLPRFIWSFDDRTLPGDADPTQEHYQRYVNPEWYNSTYFSIVSETLINGPIWLTEKTFKPIANYHPYMIAGQAGALQYLHKLGFESFENLFNECYDQQAHYADRLQTIKLNVDQFRNMPYSTLTQEKLTHNHNHFYNQSLVTKLVVKEVINPLIEYAETK